MLGGSGFTSRLFEEVRGRRGLAYSVYSYFMPMEMDGPFMMGVQTRVDQAEEAIGVIRDVLARFREEGPDSRALGASKRNITGGFPLRIASNSNMVDNLAMMGFYDLPLDYLERFSERVEAVDEAAIREAFQRRLDPERMVTVIVGGER